MRKIFFILMMIVLSFVNIKIFRSDGYSLYPYILLLSSILILCAIVLFKNNYLMFIFISILGYIVSSFGLKYYRSHIFNIFIDKNSSGVQYIISKKSNIFIDYTTPLFTSNIINIHLSKNSRFAKINRGIPRIPYLVFHPNSKDYTIHILEGKDYKLIALVPIVGERTDDMNFDIVTKNSAKYDSLFKKILDSLDRNGYN